MAFLTRKLSASVIRPLRAERAEDCADMHAGAFAHGWSTSEIAALLTAPATVGSAALDPASNRLRGFAMSRVAADEAEILTIAVDARLRNRGVGRDLLRAHMASVAMAGARALFLEVDVSNAPAIALYSHYGFAKVGERVGYYRHADGSAATALVMRRDLA